jgi:hypothetical protein
MCAGDAGAEQRVQQLRRVVAEEQVLVEVGELAVEQRVRPQQRHDRLQVPVGRVAEIEAEDAAADGDAARARPALAPHARHRLARRAARADRDVEQHHHDDAAGDQHEVERGDVVGVAQRHVRPLRGPERHQQRDRGHDRAGQHLAPGRRLLRVRGRGSSSGWRSASSVMRARAGGRARAGAAVRSSKPVSARASASDVIAMTRPATSSST